MLLVFIFIKMTNSIERTKYEKPKDRLFDATTFANKAIHSHLFFAGCWQVISWFIIDSLFVFLSVVFISCSKNYRIIVAVCMFYVIRHFVQLLQTLPYPQEQYWDDPGVPTLVNMYGNQTDFFYSGHIGFCILCTIEFFKCQKKILGAYGVFAFWFTFVTLLSFRLHYTVDIFAGCVMAHYWYYLSGLIIKETYW